MSLYGNPVVISHCLLSQLQYYFSPSFHDKFLKLEVFSIHPNPHVYGQLSLTLTNTEAGEFVGKQNNNPFKTCLRAQSCPTLCNTMDYNPLGFSVHGIFLVKNTGVGCHFFFQRIFPSQDLNPHLLHWGRFFTTESSGRPSCYVEHGAQGARRATGRLSQCPGKRRRWLGPG